VKANELHEQTIDELRQRVRESKEKYFNLKIQLATNQLGSTADVTKLRKDIARIKTVLRHKELQG
jgi:large subunit ribosomal protein L29